MDAAYAKWSPVLNDTWTVTGIFGKMDNPFELDNMVWDYDINPEGGAIQLACRPDDRQTLKLNSAFIVLDEINQAPTTAGLTSVDARHDPYLLGSQLLWKSKWSPKIETSLGVAIMDIAHHDSLSAKLQPFYNAGNTRDANGFLKYNYDPVIGTASATYKLKSFPA